MSRQRIQAYRRKLAELHAATGSLNERVLSKAFGDLLESWGKSHELIFTPQWEGKSPRGNDIAVDGALVPPVLRVPFGYLEAKDSKDDLDREIAKKRAAGYPDDNIIYEDTVTAVLRQNGKESDRTPLTDDDGLARLLGRFFAFERPELAEFRAAAGQFRADLPQVLAALRQAVDDGEATRPKFKAALADFLAHARSAINPSVTPEDVREMLIQHVLTEEIFASVFDDAGFHRENNVARRLGELEAAFFTAELRRATTERLRPYYNAIKHAGTNIADRREKQVFLKKLYEEFYKVYNPKAADRLGVVYTPNEIVRFMIRAADWLCEKHFGRCLIDPGVEILDPATGTGTYIVELLEHFRGQPDKLRHKYAEELHVNEVAILPYYVANLNIEATYAAITGGYREFQNLCFVDTLDNTAGLGIYAGHQHDMLGGMSDENIGRIKRQNERRISVVIGNPPYNANQRNENDNNKNRTYKRVDERIKATYLKESNATKTKLYDMYARFFRWASDRIRDDGVVCFITNRSFIDAYGFDGFRRTVAREFAEGYVIDLGGDYKKDGDAGGGNVFGIGTGVAISLWVKRKGAKGPAKLRYVAAPREDAREKLAWLAPLDPEAIGWRDIKPDLDAIWYGPAAAWTKDTLPIADPATKATAGSRSDRSLFKLYSLGVVTNRDDWVYGRHWKTCDCALPITPMSTALRLWERPTSPPQSNGRVY